MDESSWSSGARHDYRHRRDWSRSPVQYREKPLQYHPPVFCWCGVKTPRWISWSDDNAGRRYYSCGRAPKCGFFQWHDDELPRFLNQLILDLRANLIMMGKENDRMYEELQRMRSESSGVDKEKKDTEAESSLLVIQREEVYGAAWMQPRSRKPIGIYLCAVVFFMCVFFTWR